MSNEDHLSSIRECVRAVQVASEVVEVNIDLRVDSQPEDVDALIDAINQNTTLCEIHLDAPHGTSASEINSFFHGKTQLLLESIFSEPQLVKVSLPSWNLGGPDHRDHAEAIAHAIRSNGCSLEQIFLHHNLFDDKDCEILINALSQNTSVSLLYLVGNHVGNGGAISFADNLIRKKKSSLRSLFLQGNQIDCVGNQALMSAICNSGLKVGVITDLGSLRYLIRKMRGS